jgi:hypothetical protein
LNAFVTLLPVILVTLAAVPAEVVPRAPTEGVSRLPTVATVERIPLLRDPGSVMLMIYPFSKLVELHTNHDSKGLATRIASAKSRLCPRTLLEQNTITLQCTTRRLDSVLVREKGQLFLEIYELRGIPSRGDEHRINVFYNPLTFQLGDGCPGNTSAARGECAFREGKYTVAAVEFRRALSGDGRRVAAIRLGDLALINQDPGTAAGWYYAAGRAGAFGRVAAARLCELSGNCFTKARRSVLSASMLPEPLYTEMLLRAARVSAYLDEIPQAMQGLKNAIDAAHGGCDGSTMLFCRQLLLGVLQNANKEGVIQALDTYLALTGRTEGPLAMELIHTAAERAAAMGAPIFAGNLMAASGQSVEAGNKADLGDFLLRTAELYLAGHDRTRARVVGEFAETRLGRAKMVGPRWIAVLREMQGDEDGDSTHNNVAVAEVTRDLALAYTALARANSVRLSAEGTGDESARAP